MSNKNPLYITQETMKKFGKWKGFNTTKTKTYKVVKGIN